MKTLRTILLVLNMLIAVLVSVLSIFSVIVGIEVNSSFLRLIGVILLFVAAGLITLVINLIKK